MANIIGSLPVTLTNGTTADASQVMDNLNFIVNAVNAGALPATPGGFTTNGNQIVNGMVTINEPANGNGTLTINGQSDTNGACILLAGNGATTPNKYLHATAGVFAIANSAFTQTILILDDSGDLTATGNVTAYSDERLKKNWKPLDADFLEKLAAVKSGTFERTDTDGRQAGVGAQSLRAVLPEAVLEHADGMLSVAYGQAALAACVELAKEVMRLRALLEPVK